MARESVSERANEQLRACVCEWVVGDWAIVRVSTRESMCVECSGLCGPVCGARGGGGSLKEHVLKRVKSKYLFPEERASAHLLRPSPD